MTPLHYIIFHPDYAREKLEIKADAIINGNKENWQGFIWIDEQKGNEDPPMFFTQIGYTHIVTQPKLNGMPMNMTLM